MDDIGIFRNCRLQAPADSIIEAGLFGSVKIIMTKK